MVARGGVREMNRQSTENLGGLLLHLECLYFSFILERFFKNSALNSVLSFPHNTLKISFHCRLASIIADDKLAVTMLLVLVIKICHCIN